MSKIISIKIFNIRQQYREVQYECKDGFEPIRQKRTEIFFSKNEYKLN
jgi:hypothetical protein